MSTGAAPPNMLGLEPPEVLAGLAGSLPDAFALVRALSWSRLRSTGAETPDELSERAAAKY